MAEETNSYQGKASLYELQADVKRYPFDQSARVMLLKRMSASQHELPGEELRTASLFVPDRKVLFYMIEGNRYNLEPIQKKKENSIKPPGNRNGKAGDRTSTLINTFLDKMPDEHPKRKLTLADAANDYAAYLEQQEDCSENENTLAAIGSPDEEPVIAGNAKTIEVDNSKNGCLTETLAKIYIKQAKFVEAIEIMRKLSADNPKKSCYFADQIRFLEKVVINNKSKK